MTRDEAQTLWQLAGRDAALVMLGPFEREWFMRKMAMFVPGDPHDFALARAREYTVWMAIICDRREIKDEVAA